MHRIWMLLAFVGSGLSVNVSAGATLVVDPAGGGYSTEIQPALDAASDGDTVIVRPGEYSIAARLDFNRLRDPGSPGDPVKNLILRSEAGPRETILRWTGEPPFEYDTGIVTFRSGETGASLIEGFTMVGGPAAIWSWGGSPVIRRCILAYNGYGVDASVGVRVEECLVTGNGWGVSYEGGNGTILRSTIAGNNTGVGLYSDTFITGSIIWGNPFNEIYISGTVSYSNIDHDDVPPGPGNIRADPLFCGWASAEVHVDVAAPEGGDGTPAEPYRDLQAALGDPFAYSHSLAPGSPSIGTGEGGSNMGVDLGTCSTAPIPRRMVRVAEGSYSVEGIRFVHASLDGAGMEETVLLGRVSGLDSGAVLSDVTVTGGTDGGISFRVVQGEGPAIERCRITGNQGGGLVCFGPATVTDCIIERNQGEFFGGGVRCDGRVVLRNSRITDNAAIRGGGVFIGNGGPPLLDHCTVSGNAGGGIWIEPLPDSSATITSSIVWGNVGRPALLLAEGGLPPAISFSVIEGDAVWPGPGNLGADPLFCGGSSGPIVHVDAAAPGPGDGSAEDPYPDLDPVLAYGYGLAAGSPCLGSGDGSSDMGAPGAPCGAPGTTGGLILLAPGEYDLGLRPLARGFSIAGSGEEKTIIRGTVEGLGSEDFLGFLSVTEGTEGGVRIVGESPRVLHATLRGSDDGGLGCWDASPSIEASTIRENREGVICDESAAELTNCLILGNYRAALSSMGALSPTLRNCTITGNSGLPFDRGGIRCDGTMDPVLTNCIIWQNPIDSSCGTQTACLEGIDPLFVSPGVFDFTRFRLVDFGGAIREMPDFIVEEPDLALQPGSPAVDAGSAGGAPWTDIAGDLRPCGLGPDIGAYEIGGCSGDAIADDADPDTWSSGTWSRSGGANPYDGRSLFARDPGAAYAFFVPLPGPGTYRVSLWWTEWPSRLASVPIEVLHGGGSTVIPVDQRTNGGMWNTLGEWSFDGARAIVIVHSPGGGTVSADAVRVSAAAPTGPIILDNGQPGTSFSGNWPISGGPDPYGATSLYSRSVGGRYDFDLVLPEPGNYEVFLWWTTFSSRSESVRVGVEHALGMTSVHVNQRIDGGRWNSIGTYAFGEEARITVYSPGGDTVCADAVKLEPSSAQSAPAEVVVDNGEAGTSSSGSWLLSGGLHPYGSTSLYSHQAGATYSYVLEVPRDGTYEVFLWWTTYASRLASVRVDIDPGDGTLETRFIDQRTDGGAWKSIGMFAVRGRATITIHSGGGGSTCADAVRVLERP